MKKVGNYLGSLERTKKRRVTKCTKTRLGQKKKQAERRGGWELGYALKGLDAVIINCEISPQTTNSQGRRAQKNNNRKNEK